MLNGGTEIISSGGVANRTVLSNGGVENNSGGPRSSRSWGSAVKRTLFSAHCDPTDVSAGGIEIVNSGGVTSGVRSGTVVFSGGGQTVNGGLGSTPS